MHTKPLILSSLLALTASGSAFANPGKDVPRDEVLTGHAADVRKLLAETHDARAALSRDEPRVAHALIDDALQLEATLSKDHKYALIGTAKGTYEQLTQEKNEPVVTAYDRFSEKELLDLNATRRDLLNAKSALSKQRSSDADRSLASIERAILLEDHVAPQNEKLVMANLALAMDEARSGNWEGVKVAVDTAAKDFRKSHRPAKQSPSAKNAKRTTKTSKR